MGILLYKVMFAKCKANFDVALTLWAPCVIVASKLIMSDKNDFD